MPDRLATRTRVLFGGVLLCLALAAPSGCGDDDDDEPKGSGSTKQETTAPAFDVAELETRLQKTLTGSGSSGGPKVTSVDCPDVKGAKGESFDCQAAGEQGLAGTVTVTLQDAAGKAYKYKGELKSANFTQEVSGSATGG